MRRQRRLFMGIAVAVVAAVLGVVAIAADRVGPVASPGPPAVREPPLRSVSIVAGGDVLTESMVRVAAERYGAAIGARFDFAPVFAPVRRIISSADAAICHMELPIGVAGGAFGVFGRSPFGGNRLLAPYEIAPGLRATGFDRCSTASNHSYDLGDGAIATTIDVLSENGLDSTGTATSAGAAGPDHFTVGRVRFAHVSFTNYSNTVQPSDPWRLNITKHADVIAAQIHRARSEGAEVVLLSLHVSKELLAAPAPEDRALVAAVIRASGVDAVFMHGPHVVQPFEVVEGTPVWWSLGNFVSEMGIAGTGRYEHPRTSDGLLASVRFTERAGGGFDLDTGSIAICNDPVDRTVRAATTDLRRDDLPSAIRSHLVACLARTRAVVVDAK